MYVDEYLFPNKILTRAILAVPVHAVCSLPALCITASPLSRQLRPALSVTALGRLIVRSNIRLATGMWRYTLSECLLLS